MGFWSSVGSALSSIGSAIGSAIGSIGSAVLSFASGVGASIAAVVGTVAVAAQSLGKFASIFLQALGIFKPDEKPEEVGERALQAAGKGITMDKFDKFDDYMKALRDFELDPEASAKRNPAEKLVAGIGVGTVGLEVKFNAAPGSLHGIWLLPLSNPDYFTPERMQGLVSAGRLGGDIWGYLEKKLSDGEVRVFEKTLEAGASDSAQLYAALDSARGNWAELKQQIEAKNPPTQGA